MTRKPPKLKKCKAKSCGTMFTPARPLAVCCSPMCALEVVRERREREAKKAAAKDRVETRAKLKRRSDFLREAQISVNKYVRMRDYGKGCISCEKSPEWSGQWHASHFRSVGAASSLRFNLWNIHKSCSVCNNWKSGNISEYAPRLIEKIGKEKFEYLLSQNRIERYSIEYLVRMKSIFNKKANRAYERIRNKVA